MILNQLLFTQITIIPKFPPLDPMSLWSFAATPSTRGAGFGEYKIAASFVSVPEAAVHKDDRFVFGQYDVRMAGKVFYMQAVTKPIGKQELSDQHLGPGVFAFDAAHVEATGGDVVHIGHNQR